MPAAPARRRTSASTAIDGAVRRSVSRVTARALRLPPARAVGAPLAAAALLVALLALVAAPLASAQAPPSRIEIRRGDEVVYQSEEPAGAIRVLFVGNSLTYYNELPWMFQSLMGSVAPKPPVVARFAGADGRSLETNWADDGVRRTLRSERWDYVVLQETSRVLTLGAGHREALVRFTSEIRERGAVPVLFATWPSRHRDVPWEEEAAVLRRHYVAVARDLGVTLVPAGTAWEAARAAGIDTYQDAVHPNLAGTYLTACVLAVALLDLDPRGATASFDTDFVDADDSWRAALAEETLSVQTARRLQDIAWRVGKGSARPAAAR